MLDLGANCLRIYHTPPVWFLDLAQEMGLKIFLDVAWPKNLTFVGDEELTAAGARGCAKCGAGLRQSSGCFAISVVNEIPSDIVRYVGRQKIDEFIDDLVMIAKAEAPDCLFTFANFPTTEYLTPAASISSASMSICTMKKVFRNYLARLQNIAGEKPLMLGEYGDRHDAGEHAGGAGGDSDESRSRGF